MLSFATVSVVNAPQQQSQNMWYFNKVLGAELS